MHCITWRAHCITLPDTRRYAHMTHHVHVPAVATHLQHITYSGHFPNILSPLIIWILDDSGLKFPCFTLNLICCYSSLIKLSTSQQSIYFPYKTLFFIHFPYISIQFPSISIQFLACQCPDC